ncbi:restriction endonuclease subunit S [Streptosporangium sp. NPDC006013]|uniref:restriction endonuclease subunit S n=1 Tax=Streptosporangium sp. NPDC006013 TaxID=3155596 RepID=UPI0033BB292D
MTERYTEHVDSGVPRGGHEMTRLHWLVQHERPMTYGILQAGELVDGGVAYVGPSDITGEGASPELDALRTTAPEIAANYRRSVLVGGDVVVSIGPAYGKVAVVSDDLAGANLTQDTVRVALRPELIDTRFLVWALLSSQTAEYWDYQIMGATFRRLNLGTLARTPIPLPPLEKQRAIADYLDRETARIDTLIEEQQRLIEMLRERRKALIEKTVFAGLWNADTNNRPELWLPSTPVHWRVVQLGFMCDTLAGYAFPSDAFSIDEAHARLLRGVNVKPGRIDWAETVYWDTEASAVPSEYELEAGDLVFGMDRPFVGSGVRVAALSSSDLPALLLQRVMRIRPTAEGDRGYVQYVMLTDAFFDYLEPLFTGVSVPHVSEWQVRKFKMPFPPLDEQRSIAAHLDEVTAKIDQLIAETERFVDLARERRAALITAAVTGQIDVREVA